jgi:predicted HD phosphohydrolase
MKPNTRCNQTLVSNNDNEEGKDQIDIDIDTDLVETLREVYERKTGKKISPEAVKMFIRLEHQIKAKKAERDQLDQELISALVKTVRELSMTVNEHSTALTDIKAQIWRLQNK